MGVAFDGENELSSNKTRSDSGSCFVVEGEEVSGDSLSSNDLGIPLFARTVSNTHDDRSNVSSESSLMK